ncbi:MAG: phosphoglucomutase [Candidatus Epulonipiscioides saccharophilum]|nr:MAG: phosphoglucomutase [Epulopiscium sp. AS2M-Bin001]
MNYKERYNEWLTDKYFDQATKDELESIKGNEKEIEDRFYTELEFGTAGLRGVIGAGTNRMNKYIVTKATQGLANFLNKQKLTNPKVVIAYDSRNKSDSFAMDTALTLAANGIKAYLFESLRAVPQLSFALRALHADAGVVITASHNPPEYNGYKVYGNDGAQVIAPFDKMIIDEVNNIKDFSTIKTMTEDQAKAEGLLEIIGEDIDKLYIDQVTAQVINPDVIKKVADNFKIVYTPLHGSGNVPVRRALKEVGFKHVYVVAEQEKPDGNFPTITSPNPEDSNAFKLAIDLAKKENADLIIGTDPDADRVGVLIRDEKGEYIGLTGNMIGTMLTDYILKGRQDNGTLPSNGVVIKTIVTTEMIRPICKLYGADVIEVLTGFKFIGEQIKNFEKTGQHSYVFGFEESYGALPGTYARDKDAIAVSMLVCEMAAYYKLKGLTLYEALIDLYKKFGYYKEDVQSFTLKGIEGLGKIKNIMSTLRTQQIDTIGGYDILAKRDYKAQERITKDGQVSKIELPVSDVIYFELSNNAWICVRPSGTEPKIKFYIGIKGDNLDDANNKIQAIKDDVLKILEPLI